MATLNSFEDIEVWKNSRLLCCRIFAATTQESFARDYKLKDQINGSAGSIMDNIAEGFERDGSKEFIQFLSYAKGSAGETRSQLYRAHDRGYLTKDQYEELLNEVISISKQISGFINYLKKSGIRGTKYLNEPLESYLSSNRIGMKSKI